MPLPTEGWKGALRLLAEEAAAAMGSCVESARVYADALEREQTDSTYIGMELAVPHARIAGLTRAGLYAACSGEGIAWPHEKARVIVLLVVPQEMPEWHLQLLSRLVRWRRSLEEAALAEPAALAASLRAAFAEAQ